MSLTESFLQDLARFQNFVLNDPDVHYIDDLRAPLNSNSARIDLDELQLSAFMATMNASSDDAIAASSLHAR